MPWITRHLLAIGLVTIAVCSTGAVFIFATPRYRPPGNPHLVKMASEDHYTDAEVKRAFAREGIVLVRKSRFFGMTFFAEKHPGRLDDGFLVSKYEPTATVSVNSSGPKMMVDKWLGNVEVSYGGHDAAFAARVTAAVEALKH